MYMKHNMQILL